MVVVCLRHESQQWSKSLPHFIREFSNWVLYWSLLHPARCHQQPVLFFKSLTQHWSFLPGNYDITKSVGNIVTVGISDFRLKASSLENGNVSIVCQPDARLGFTFIKSHNIEISEIQISHCSANIDSVNISLVLGNNSIRYFEKYLKQNFSQEVCDSTSINHILCYISIACFIKRNW